jgi:hypothetical protein
LNFLRFINKKQQFLTPNYKKINNFPVSAPKKHANENHLEKIQAKVINNSVNSLEFLHFGCFSTVTT